MGKTSGPLPPHWSQAVGQVVGYQWADGFLFFRKLNFLKKFIWSEKLTFLRFENYKCLLFSNLLRIFETVSERLHFWIGFQIPRMFQKGYMFDRVFERLFSKWKVVYISSETPVGSLSKSRVPLRHWTSWFCTRVDHELASMSSWESARKMK